MTYGPAIQDANPVRTYALPSRKHSALLMDSVKTTGSVTYKFVLAVFDDYTRRELLYVTSELNSRAVLSGEGSHFLCLFHNDQHSNFGASDDWSDIDKFAEAAMAIALRELDEPMEATHSPTSVLTYEDYRALTEDLHSAFRSLSIVEQELMSPQLAAVDFFSYRLKLESIHDSCVRVRSTLSPYVNQTAGNYAINAAITFADSLLDCVIHLREICARLDEKARGGKYGFFQYRRDIKEYQRKDAAREIAGSQLNSAFQRAW
jgi:hypothetical protein